MGEAKRRGTLKERQAEGVVKQLQKARDRAIAQEAYEASLTPEQKEKRRKAQILLGTMVGIAATAKTIR